MFRSLVTCKNRSEERCGETTPLFMKLQMMRNPQWYLIPIATGDYVEMNYYTSELIELMCKGSKM